MGFYDNIKKGAKGYAKDWQKSSAEKREYTQKVSEAVKKSRREAFLKEAEKQARLKAKLDAQRRYNPPQQQRSQVSSMSDQARSILNGGFGSPAQRVEQKIVKPKKKKKKAVQQQIIYVIQQQAKKKKKIKKQVKKIVAKPVDRVEELLKNMPQ